jgi:hypothetical protein
MSRMTRIFLMIAAFAIPVLIAIGSQVRPERPSSGEEWLSWSLADRNAYIGGYIDGYTKGSHEACLATNDIFEVHKPHHLGEDPAARCESHLETYSKYQTKDSRADLSVYVTVITEFYTKHPEYRNIPFFYLMRFLSDSQRKTADQIYEMALKGEIRTTF